MPPTALLGVDGGALQHTPVVVDRLDEDLGLGDRQVVEAIPGEGGQKTKPPEPRRAQHLQSIKPEPQAPKLSLNQTSAGLGFRV